MKLISQIRKFSNKLIPKMNYEHALKVVFEGIEFEPSKHWEFSAASTADLTMARLDLNKRHVRCLVPVSRENKRCTSQLVLTLLN